MPRHRNRGTPVIGNVDLYVPELEAKDPVNQLLRSLYPSELLFTLTDVFAAAQNQAPVALTPLSPTLPQQSAENNDISERKVSFDRPALNSCPPAGTGRTKSGKSIETTVVRVKHQEGKYKENGEPNKSSQKSSVETNSMQLIFATILEYYADDVLTEADFLTPDTGTPRKEVKKSTKTPFGLRKKAAKKIKKDCKHEWREVCTLCESVKKPHPQKACKKIKVCSVCKEGAVVIHSPRKLSPSISSTPTIVRNITTNNNITNNIINYYMVPSPKDLRALQHQMVKPSTPSNPVGLNFKLIHSQENSQQGLILQKQKKGSFRDTLRSWPKRITTGIKGMKFLEL